MSKLNWTARETIKNYAEFALALNGTRLSIAGYTRHYFGDAGWQGDRCGCGDDRCIGFHHYGEDDCQCLESWLDSYAVETRRT